MQLPARSHSHEGIYPEDAGAACESGLNPMASFQSFKALPTHRSRQFRRSINDKPVSSLGAIRSFAVYPISRLYYKSPKRQCGRFSAERSDAAGTVQTLQLSGFAIARRRSPRLSVAAYGGPAGRRLMNGRRFHSCRCDEITQDAFSLENALAVTRTRRPAAVISRRSPSVACRRASQRDPR
jgi:hypothetical protein